MTIIQSGDRAHSIVISTTFAVASPPEAAPDEAVTFAAPVAVPAVNVVRARPSRVVACSGSTVPSVVENRTTVPLWTGVPTSSTTTANTSVLPPGATLVTVAETELVDATGATSGSRSQEAIAAMVNRTSERRRAADIFITIPSRESVYEAMPHS